jgi:hypothetical protein
MEPTKNSKKTITLVAEVMNLLKYAFFIDFLFFVSLRTVMPFDQTRLKHQWGTRGSSL